jgi:solute carrier family 35 protein E3
MSAPKNENSRLFVIGGILVNIVSSVAIIQVNKYIYVNYGYPNMSLTCLHFIITFLGLLLCERFGVFKIKKVPIVKMLPMAASFCGFVVLTNYSLQYNTVGTYQCLKALTTPIVVVISIYLYNQKYSTKVKLTVVPILLGILVNSMYDLKFNTFGLVIGLVGAVITSFYQVVS